MKKIVTLIAVISMLTSLFCLESFASFAQRGMKWKGSSGWGMRTQYARMYDSKSVETITGEVLSIDKITPMKRMSYGIHLIVKTDKETISVHLGPGWYIENQDIKINPKDKVDVKGSRITFKGKPAIIAAEVKKGDETLKLRDENGFPVWSGWRRR
ncbi:MAG: DNA-binding protein [Thermodesulfobacteriota bacterium]